MRILRRADAVAQPWRNGGGVTNEVLREPPEGHFVLRISIADIREDGMFSEFEGIDRVIALLEGDGCQLRRDDGLTVELDEVGVPFAFAGEDGWSCTLYHGPVCDLNVMVDREVYAVIAARVVDEDLELGVRGFAVALAPEVEVGGTMLGLGDVYEGSGRVSLAGAALQIELLDRR
jgi:uncharacterized protein